MAHKDVKAAYFVNDRIRAAEPSVATFLGLQPPADQDQPTVRVRCLELGTRQKTRFIAQPGIENDDVRIERPCQYVSCLSPSW